MAAAIITSVDYFADCERFPSPMAAAIYTLLDSHDIRYLLFAAVYVVRYFRHADSLLLLICYSERYRY